MAVKVRGSRGKSKPVVLKCATSSPVAMGEHALGELAKQVGSGHWTLPLHHGDYQMLVLAEPPVQESEMESSLRWSLSSVIDFPLEEAVIEWMRIPTEEFDPNRERQIYVVVARQSLVDSQIDLFRKAKVALKAVEVRETALRNIAALLERKQEGLGLITVGAAGVTTTFTYKGELYLDRFIAQSLDDVIAGDAAFQQRFLDRIAQQAYQSMDLLGRNYPFITVGRIVVAPVEDLDVAGHLRGKLPVPVEPLELGEIIDISAAPELSKPHNQARYLVALGAALRGNKAAV